VSAARAPQQGAVAEPRLPPPFTWRAGQIAADLPGGHVLFTTRSGGDLAVDGASETLRAAAGPPLMSWAQDRQVHGARVRVIGAADPVGALEHESDGLATARRDVACVVRTADCLPLALISPQAVAMLHGGWRGLAAGIVAEGVHTLRALGAREIRAAAGPHAAVCCYEAGDEVHAAFAPLGPSARRGDHADLQAITGALLAREGVDELHATGICTICSAPGLLWSHRRDGDAAGRQGGIAWRS
jgi:YfiH family protein